MPTSRRAEGCSTATKTLSQQKMIHSFTDSFIQQILPTICQTHPSISHCLGSEMGINTSQGHGACTMMQQALDRVPGEAPPASTQAVPLKSSLEASNMLQHEAFISQVNQRHIPTPPPKCRSNPIIQRCPKCPPLLLQNNNGCYLKEIEKGKRGIPGHRSLETADLINAGFLGALKMFMYMMDHQEKIQMQYFPELAKCRILFSVTIFIIAHTQKYSSRTFPRPIPLCAPPRRKTSGFTEAWYRTEYQEKAGKDK